MVKMSYFVLRKEISVVRMGLSRLFTMLPTNVRSNEANKNQGGHWNQFLCK